MFQPYFDLGDRIRKHYLSPSVLLCLASGQHVPPIHRRNLYSLQYSMLPVRRHSIHELWDKLNGKDSTASQIRGRSEHTELFSRTAAQNGDSVK